MIARVVAACTRRPGLILALALVIVLVGELSRRTLKRDAIPDLSNPQIVIVVDWMGHPAAAVASDVTRVLTRALEGVPGTTAVRGASMSGTAYIDVVFGSARGLGAGRQAIAGRVARLRGTLPRDARVEVGPVASSTGWVFQYALIDPHRKESAVAMRAFQDNVLRPALAAVPGVAEVATVGAGVQQVVVELDRERLRGRGVAFSEVVAAVEPAIASRDAHTGSGKSLETLEVAAQGARVGDVGRVRLLPDLPTGLADYRGVEPAIGGVVVARRDADIQHVIEGVTAALERARPQLPRGLELVTAYDRQDLITQAGHTLLRALGEEVGVVVLVILLFLMHGRSALVPLLTLPVVLLLTFLAMRVLGVTATIMSVGGVGIALGMAVDADVVALEACHRRLEGLGGTASPSDRRVQLLAAAGSLAPAILISLIIAALTFLPVFAFTGESGRLLRPLALGKTLVIAAAAIVTLTLAPVLRDRLLRGRVKAEFDNPLTRWTVRLYRPFVHFALTRPAVTLATGALAVVSVLPILVGGRLGGEFLPRIDEGDLLFMPTTLPGAMGDETAHQLFRQDRALRAFPEVTAVLGKVGRADTATDPAPYGMAETTLRLRPRAEWPLVRRERWYSSWTWLPGPWKGALGMVWPEATPETTAELVEKLDRATRMPGWVGAWTAPARARMDMMATGVRTPVGIRVVAPDPARLDAIGSVLRTVVSRVGGTRGAVFESLGGEPWLRFTPDAAALARYHVDSAVVEHTATLLATGGQVGEVEQDGHKLRVRVAPDVFMSGMMGGELPVPVRGRADQMREATVRAQDGSLVPLALLGRVDHAVVPAMIRSERGETVAYVYIDLDDGADVQRYVDRAQKKVDQALASQELHLLPGERIEWTGQYELLASGQKRLAWIVPLVALSMLALLYLQFKSLSEALIVLISVPFALVGSFWTLYLLGYPLSAPVWVGLLSVVGLAMQTGVVMVVYIDEAFFRRVRAGTLRTRDDIVAAHAEGTVQRLRPKLMTITTMAAGLLPLLWSDGAGAEIMRRVAAPMVGGLATSAFLTLEILPVLYTLWRTRQLRRAERTGMPLATIVGAPPAWAYK
jgi:Cu(I)/Ag(I) efflux system membrane protein CusA/SilA